MNLPSAMSQRDRTATVVSCGDGSTIISQAEGWRFDDAISFCRSTIFVGVDMKYSTQYDRNVKPHEWDFTLTTTRDSLSGGDTMQAVITSRAPHPLLHHGTIGIKAVGWHIVQSFRRIVS